VDVLKTLRRPGRPSRLAVLRHDLVDAEDSWVPVERVLHATWLAQASVFSLLFSRRAISFSLWVVRRRRAVLFSPVACHHILCFACVNRRFTRRAGVRNLREREEGGRRVREGRRERERGVR
jgi:hypothetical protein